MRILVIGGTRFMGPYVVRSLVEEGHDLTVFHRGQTPCATPPEVKHIHGDRQNLNDFASDFTRLAPDVVLDMILSTEEQAHALIQTFKGIAGRIVMPSSMDVYRAYGRLLRLEQGEPDPVPYTEDGPLREVLYPYRQRATGPDDFAYKYEKILAERVLMNEPSMPATVLRLAAVYGPRDKQHRLFEYLKRMDDGRPFILLEERKAAWRWSRGFVENVAAGIALAVTDERASGRIYNVGEADALMESDWIMSIARAAGWNGEILIRKKSAIPKRLLDDAPYEHHLVADSSRIRDELGYTALVGRDEAIKRTIEWERANPPAAIDPAQFDYAAEDAALEEIRGRDFA